MKARTLLGIGDLSVFPLMPAPDSSLEPTKRPVSTLEQRNGFTICWDPSC